VLTFRSMNFFSSFLRFTEWALEAVLNPRVLVVCVLAVTSLTLAAIRQKPFERQLWKPYHWLVLTHLLFFPAVIAALRSYASGECRILRQPLPDKRPESRKGVRRKGPLK
jgi:hypothetical protein